MMLKHIQSKTSIKKKLLLLKNAIVNGKVVRPKNISKFIFLCGGNKGKARISERRNAILEFSKIHLPHTKFFLAENIFSILQKEGHKGNLLDIENEISKFADKIIIVLESSSAFTEFGAFSHEELRKKLIIINDERFRKSESFINLGPAKAIEEISGVDHLIHYKMHENGIHEKDAIGDVFSPLYNLLHEPLISRAEAMNKNSCNPAHSFDKYSVMFVHDLIYFTGPISHAELAEVLKQLFDKNNFKIKEHVAMLTAFGALSRNESGFYKSLVGGTYLEYKFDCNKLISIFRNSLMRYEPKRLYEY